MKYYIALSSLNIDNILSSESISPYSFYEKRDFGYRSFQKIKNITLQNDILLFSQLPYFTIQDADSENYPMVIEIEDDKQLNKKIRKISSTPKEYDVFQCNESIYLNPWNCKILFFTQQAITLARLKCEDSLCNKLGHLFRIELISQNKSILLTNMLKDLSFQESPFNLPKFVVDSKINKIKGFLFAYYLGITKSLSQDTAQLLSIQKRIYNIVASIINNKGISNEHFNEELRILDTQYNEIDPHKKELRQIWSEKVLSRFSSKDDKSAFESILRELSVESDAKMNFCRSNNILIRKMPFSLSNKSFEWTTYQNELNSYTQNIIYEDKLKRQNIDLEKEVSIKSDYNGVSLISRDSKLYNDIISKFFFDNVTTIEDLRLKKLDIATEFTKEVKNILQSEHIDWESSPERVYLNSLRQNIANSEPFNLKQSPNIITMSIAAFLLKGDDFDALSRYLEENGVPNYSYVLGFWGAACGYIDMPKPMSKPLVSNKDKFCNIYKSVYYLLHDTNLPDTFPEVVNQQVKIAPLEPVEKSLIIASTNNEINKQKLLNAISCIQQKFGKKVTDKQKDAINRAYEVSMSTDNFLSLLKKNGIKTSTNIYKEFELVLMSDNEPKVSGSLNLFPEVSIEDVTFQNDFLFLRDSNRWNHIFPLILNDKSLKQFKIDLDWFLDNHEESYFDDKKGKQRGFYFGKPSENKYVLDRFEIYLNNKRENKLKWLSDIYKFIPVDKIIERLRYIYK